MILDPLGIHQYVLRVVGHGCHAPIEIESRSGFQGSVLAGAARVSGAGRGPPIDTVAGELGHASKDRSCEAARKLPRMSAAVSGHHERAGRGVRHRTAAPRPLYDEPAREPRGSRPARRSRRMSMHCSWTQGVTFGGESGAFRLDPVPRLIDAAEWALAGARARAARPRARRLRGRRLRRPRIVARGRDARAGDRRRPTTSSRWMRGSRDAGAAAAWRGLDLVRGDDGVLRVLEDNMRTPSGIAYAGGRARRRSTAHLPGAPPRGLRDPAPALRPARRRAARGGAGRRRRPGDRAALRRAAQQRLVRAPPDRAAARPPARAARATWPTRGGRLRARVDARDARRRRGLPAHRRGPPARPRRARHLGRRRAARPVRAGTLAVVNPFGARRGRRQARARLRRGDGPLLPRRGAAAASVPTYDLGDADVRAPRCSTRLDELVVKPRGGLRRRRAW